MSTARARVTSRLLLGTALSAALAVVSGASARDAEPAQGRAIGGAADYGVLAPRARIEPENRMLSERLEQLLPQLMAEADLDMWLVINREYAEDPVYFSLVPQPSFAARRTTMLVFHRTPDGSVDNLSVNRYPLGAPYESAWAGGDLAEQWKALGALIAEREPKRIGINVSREWPVADGLTQGLHAQLLEVLSPELRQRLVPAEGLVIRWLETRSASELAVYPHIMGIARGVISEAFSSRVITPGVTTTDDIAWYIRERFESLGLPIWFMPYVNLQRPGVACEQDNPFCGISGVVQPGDVLHTDVGICYLKLCTDTQEMAYVARAGEAEVPAGLQQALRIGNRWQDLLTAEYRTGRSGNEVLARTRAAAEKAGIVSSTYTHALGMFGHAPGPTIGMWDNQGDTPVQGDWPLHPSTVYAIEGNIKAPVPEWEGQWVQIKLEQGALFDGERVIYLAGRQTQWHVVR
ncbi:M24 family metallopeptidase [Aquimonas voraii]|uniref:Xaa-Pro aminopeptidase n=1 Tax=Aquimonas voraii TaxID=265719 RepID=A0A1G6VK19_9GAMM|nr:M24 family metallopeptidase [Aquimonas voraii]SDD53952.1 Xaa-Pro aminopeptidase [Aquimonas voraii]